MDVMPSSFSHVVMDIGPTASVKTQKSSPAGLKKTYKRDMLY